MVRYLSSVSILFAAAFALAPTVSPAQELVVTPYHAFSFVGGTGDPVVVIADLAATLPEPPLIYIAPPLNQDGPFLKPHGLTLFSASLALVSNNTGNCCGAIDVVDTIQARRVDSFSIAGYEDDGYGTLAANPAKTYLLVFSGLSNSNLYVVPAPFSATSTATAVVMPSNGGTAQTHAIAFDNATGRAYVGHISGISALDPPYTSIAFTIPLPPSNGTIRGRAVALSADGSVLASTIYGDAKVEVLNAPFSAASSATELTVDNAVALDGLTFTPDGSQLLVVDANGTAAETMAYAISAPFDSNAAIQPLDTGETVEGFEDIDISADGQYAALSGGDEDGRPLYILRAPFTTAAVQTLALQIPPLNNGYDFLGGRGTGTARFWSTPVLALPEITTDTIVSLTEGDSGTSPLVIHLRLSRPSAQAVSVDYATSDGSLSAPARYLETMGTLTFAPGETIKTVSVPVVGDSFFDGSGYFFMTFANPVNASLLGIGALVECDIVDNDGGPFPLIITNNSPLPDGFVGSPYSLTFTAQGSASGYVNWGPINSNLPAGLSLDPNTGVLSGVPTTVGVKIFAIIVSSGDGSESAVRGYQITVGSDRIFANGFE